MQSEIPLTPALSPSDGAREKPICAPTHSPDGVVSENVQRESLSPSDGERAGVRGCFNSIVTAKVAVDDQTFLRQFEESTLPRDQWHHREHVRTAYLYLTRYSFEDALHRMRQGVKALNAAHGTPETPGRGYHETMTQAWIRLVDFALREHGPARNGDEFYERHPELSQPRVLRLFYSQELLSSPEAKMNFVPPDLAPFPVPRSKS